MDVDTQQMEANGLPPQFGSTSDQSAESHVANNLAATMANSESSIPPPVKQSASPLTAQAEPLLPVSESATVPDPVPTANGTYHEAATPVENGITSTVEVPGSNTSLVPDSQPQLPPETSISSTQPDPAVISTSGSTLTDSMVPSSIPTEVASSDPMNEPSQPFMDAPADPVSLLPQPLTSDLRTSPHADELTPAAVAQVEAQKHQEDNQIDMTPVASGTDAMDTSYSAEPVQPVVPAVSEIAQSINTDLATPPAGSPPPAPHPEPATLPTTAPENLVAELPQAVAPSVQPAAPAPTPALLEPLSDTQPDHQMTDAPSPPSKLVREREEDQDESEPAPKRIKTDEGRQGSEMSDFKVPEIPATSPSLANGSPAPAAAGIADDDQEVTAPRLAHMKKIISNLKKSNASQAFRLPVDPIALNIPSYPEIVKHPMDLGTIDSKLKQAQYSSIRDFVSDFHLIVDNCLRFNGKDHAVSQQAKTMEKSFNNQMLNLPKAGLEEPSKDQKKAARAKVEPTRTAPPRRPSVSTSAVPPVGSARSPKAAPPTPSFAPGPDGVPLIRRDSNVVDGRPKRAIVPPKRNQEYAGGRPKKKKYELQLKFCAEVIKELTSSKNWQMNQYFTHPVDPVALNIPTYFQIIKKPMDLGTVQTKLENNVYERAKDFEEDVRLVFKNCYKFNPDGDFVNQCGHQLEELFNKKWAAKDDWIAAREPASEPQSDVEDDDDDDEQSDDAEEDSEDERTSKIMALQKQIAEMSKQMGELTQTSKSKKKSKSPTSAPKKSKSKSGKKEKQSAMFPGLNKPKDKKKAAVSKAKPEKDRYVTFAEKQYISNGIAMLPEKQMQEALRIIQSSVPSLANSDQNEIELDIEEVPNHALLKLLTFVKKYAGPPPDEPKIEADNFSAAPVGKSKKNKPMSKTEQEAQIEELKGKLGAYGGPVSPNAMPSIETGDESSDDEGDSETSEEE